jgi:hypothetical protein
MSVCYQHNTRHKDTSLLTSLLGRQGLSHALHLGLTLRTIPLIGQGHLHSNARDMKLGGVVRYTDIDIKPNTPYPFIWTAFLIVACNHLRRELSSYTEREAVDTYVSIAFLLAEAIQPLVLVVTLHIFVWVAVSIRIRVSVFI